MKSSTPSNFVALNGAVCPEGFAKRVWLIPLSVKLPSRNPVIVAPELLLVFSDMIWLVKVALAVTVTEVNVPSVGSNKAKGGASAISVKFVKFVGTVSTCVVVTGAMVTASAGMRACDTSDADGGGTNARSGWPADLFAVASGPSRLRSC